MRESWHGNLIKMLRMLIIYSILSSSLFLSPAFADYPKYDELHVNDYANIINAKDQNALRTALVDLRDQHGIEVTVVTLPSWKKYANHTSFERFVTGLFNHWGVGDSTRNDGVMVLIAKNDRQMRIELGKGYATGADRQMQSVIDQIMLPAFRNGDFSNGIVNGTKAAINTLHGGVLRSNTAATDAITNDTSRNYVPQDTANTSYYQAPRFLNENYSNSNHSSSEYETSSWFNIFDSWQSTLVTGAVGLFTLFMGRLSFNHWRRNRKRNCEDCGQPMYKLDEKADDAFLNAGQVCEEKLNSVDYDVWQCQGCKKTQTHRYSKLFSGYDSCPKCSSKTAKDTTTIEQRATEFSTGKKRIDTHCKHCNHRSSRHLIIPIIVPDDDDDDHQSSSFGGGSSSGGGASGSW